MESTTDNSKIKDNHDFMSDYEKIVSYSENSVIVKTEWTKKGDFFQKLSMYDNSYVPVLTFGNTTLINAL